jgi:hypothetical protein
MMESTGTLKDNLKDYVKAQLEVAKLQAINKGSTAATGVIVGVALAILSIFILMFLGFSAAYAISAATGKPFLGFLLVGVFFIILALVVVFMREKLITLPIVNALLAKFYSVPGEKQN